MQLASQHPLRFWLFQEIQPRLTWEADQTRLQQVRHLQLALTKEWVTRPPLQVPLTQPVQQIQRVQQKQPILPRGRQALLQARRPQIRPQVLPNQPVQPQNQPVQQELLRQIQQQDLLVQQTPLLQQPVLQDPLHLQPVQQLCNQFHKAI